jgi:hypothetical protein
MKIYTSNYFNVNVKHKLLPMTLYFDFISTVTFFRQLEIKSAAVAKHLTVVEQKKS